MAISASPRIRKPLLTGRAVRNLLLVTAMGLLATALSLLAP